MRLPGRISRSVSREHLVLRRQGFKRNHASLIAQFAKFQGKLSGICADIENKLYPIMTQQPLPPRERMKYGLESNQVDPCAVPDKSAHAVFQRHTQGKDTASFFRKSLVIAPTAPLDTNLFCPPI